MQCKFVIIKIVEGADLYVVYIVDNTVGELVRDSL